MLDEIQPTAITGGYLLDVAFTVTGATVIDKIGEVRDTE
jgi:hypothetical protein